MSFNVFEEISYTVSPGVSCCSPVRRAGDLGLGGEELPDELLVVARDRRVERRAARPVRGVEPGDAQELDDVLVPARRHPGAGRCSVNAPEIALKHPTSKQSLKRSTTP